MHDVGRPMWATHVQVIGRPTLRLLRKMSLAPGPPVPATRSSPPATGRHPVPTGHRQAPGPQPIAVRRPQGSIGPSESVRISNAAPSRKVSLAPGPQLAPGRQAPGLQCAVRKAALARPNQQRRARHSDITDHISPRIGDTRRA